ncbi:MAG: thymidine kinase [Spirochaetes bacterium]|nr:MAG: thymidine kinase [Spirochaetota bacterium]RKX90096.1 MAG: thymidine kinase [Spirochaetota bacterium]
MNGGPATGEAGDFLKSLGFPSIRIHGSRNHFDFTHQKRRILVIGPMGSGKTEFSAGVWRDARIAQRKSAEIADLTTTEGADRRNVFFVRSLLDAGRFQEYPEDALAYRGGYERCGDGIARIGNSFDLEKVLEDNPEHGTWIIDEASFYDERLAYVTARESERRGLMFVYPTLVLNFRREIFNSTARLLLETSTDVITLTAYCEHPDCLTDSLYTYRYYSVDDRECPALYFDPLIVIGGDKDKKDPLEPNYCTRCDQHHYLPGKEYTFFTLKPLGEAAAAGNLAPLRQELILLKDNPHQSSLYSSLKENHMDINEPQPVCLNSLLVPALAEKALIYLFVEQNLVSRDQIIALVSDLNLDREYLKGRLRDNRRVISLD